MSAVKTYQKYNVEGVNLVEFDAMYQIKPVSGNISELKPSGDNCLWFKVDADEESWAQEEGDHIFLVKHGETWSKFVVNYEAPAEPVDETDPEIKSATVEKNENGDLPAQQLVVARVTFLCWFWRGFPAYALIKGESWIITLKPERE